MHADNEDEALAILLFIGLGAFALIVCSIIYLIFLIVDWWRFR